VIFEKKAIILYRASSYLKFS